MNSELTRLLDRQAIYDCSVRYSRGLDRVDVGLMKSAFWEDGILCNGPLNGPLDEFLVWWLPLQPDRESVQHSISNQFVEFDGDDAADAETYFVASVKRYGSSQVELLTARYVDRFEKREGEWRIKSRLIANDWVATIGATTGSLAAARHQGFRSPLDPSYDRPVQGQQKRPSIQGIVV
jgi:hypothetical protein